MKTSAAIIAAPTPLNRPAICTALTFFTRSITTPPIGEKTTIVRPPRNEEMPTHSGESVICKTSQPCAVK